MSYAKKAVKSTMIVFIMLIASAIIGYLLRLVLARNLSLEEFGLFYSVLSFIGLLILFKNLGLSSALTKYLSEFQAKNQLSLAKNSIIAVFLVQFLAATIITGLIIIFSRQISSSFFHTQKAVWVLILLALSYWLSVFQDVFVSVSQGFQKMKYYSSIEFMRTLSALIVIIILLNVNKTAIIPAFAYFVVMIFLPFVYFYFTTRFFPQFLKIKTKLTKKLFFQLFKFGLPVFIGTIGGMIISFLDIVSITYFRTLEEVGLYGAVLPTVMLLWYFPQALSNVILPMASELKTKNKNWQLREGIKLVNKYSFGIILPLALAMFSFPNIILGLLFGEKFIAASPALQILAIGSIFYTIAIINSNILIGIGKPEINSKIYLMAALLNLVGNIILVPKYGINGAAFSTLLAYLLILFLSTIKIQKYVQSEIPWWNWLKTTISGLVFVVLLYYMKKIPINNLLIKIPLSLIIGTLIYVILIFIFKVIKKEEIREIIRTRFYLKT